MPYTGLSLASLELLEESHSGSMPLRNFEKLRHLDISQIFSARSIKILRSKKYFSSMKYQGSFGVVNVVFVSNLLL